MIRMSRKLVHALCLFILLYSLLFVRLYLVEVKATNGYLVHNLDSGLNYTKIQEALDAPETVDGHTILVDAGTYYEHVVVCKSVALIGENKITTIIDGSKTGNVVHVIADNAHISGFTIENTSRAYLNNCVFLDNCENVTISGNIIRFGDNCIFLRYSRRCNISDNVLTNPDDDGIRLYSSSENYIVGNNIWGVSYGIELEYASDNNALIGNNIRKVNWSNIMLSQSSFNTLRNNTLSEAFIGAKYFGVGGSSKEHFIQDIDESNTIGENPIYYWVNQHEKQVPENAGYVALINSTSIIVKGLTLRNNFQGILLAFTNNSKIENVTLSEHECGMVLYFSENNTISHSRINGCWRNVLINSSSNNTFVSNNVTSGSICNLFLESSDNNLVANNIISSSFYGTGGLGLGMRECDNNLIYGNILSDNINCNLAIVDSSNNTLRNNTIQNSLLGITIESSSANRIYNNLITKNIHGMQVLWNKTENNRIHHNNFVDNNKHAYLQGPSTNVWDDDYPSGGNFWSDYNGTDLYSGPYQNLTGSDGIGDIPYNIDTNNIDGYPLIGTLSSFNTSLGYNVNIISNSTIEDFQYFESNSTIMMHVSNMTANQTYGFCRLTIPYELMSPPCTITINGNSVAYTTVFENETLTIIYFSYMHSTLEIIITPEFPSALILPLFIVVTLLAVIAYRKKHFHR